MRWCKQPTTYSYCNQIYLDVPFLKQDTRETPSQISATEHQPEMGSKQLDIILPLETSMEYGISNLISEAKSCLVFQHDDCAKSPGKNIDSSESEPGFRENDPSEIIEQCLLHPEYHITHFCNDCNMPCCMICVEEKHRNHMYSVGVISNTRIERMDAFDDLVTDRNTLPNLESSSVQCQLRETEKENRDILNEVITGNNIRNISQKRMKCSKSHSKPSYNIPKFILGKGLVNSIARLVLEIQWEDRERHFTKLTNNNFLSNIPAFIPCHDVFSYIASLVGDFKWNVENRYIADIYGSAVVPISKNTAWIADWYSDTMHMYDITGKVIRSVIVTKQCSIWDIAVSRQGHVIVCGKDKNVRLVTKTGVVNTLIDTAPYRPQGVCLTESEDIVVCMAGMGKHNHLAVYSHDGKKKIKVIKVVDSRGKQMLTDPYRVVMNGENISVMNWMSNVVTTSQDGTLRWIYDGSQTQTGTLGARGLCVDNLNHILISDFVNQLVHYIDRNGGLIRILLTRNQHGIERPWGIGVDKVSGTIWVGSLNGKVWVDRYCRTNRYA